MHTIKKSFIACTVLTVFLALSSYENQAFARGKGERRHSPPPEAYTACEGKSAGDTAEFESPRGDTVTGTCEADGDRLVLRPDHPPRHRKPGDTEASVDE